MSERELIIDFESDAKLPRGTTCHCGRPVNGMVRVKRRRYPDQKAKLVPMCRVCKTSPNSAFWFRYMTPDGRPQRELVDYLRDAP